jgi:tRNA(Arg) A34 adenosine deaminase TadA
VACALLKEGVHSSLSPSLPKTSADDASIIRELARITRAGFTTSHPSPFGSQIMSTATRELLAQRLNQVVPHSDPTCHAEVHAIRAACASLGRPQLRGYTLYSTCEPCPMCMTACLFSGLDRVVYGTVVRRPDSTHPPLFNYSAKEFAAGSRFKCQVDGPVEEQLCRALVDDPIVQDYVARMGREGIFL